MRRITADRLAEALATANPPLVADLRPAADWTAARIAGSVSTPVATDVDALRAACAPGRTLVVCCADGRRAAALADARGLVALDGGIAAWSAARLPLVRPGGDVQDILFVHRPGVG